MTINRPTHIILRWTRSGHPDEEAYCGASIVEAWGNRTAFHPVLLDPHYPFERLCPECVQIARKRHLDIDLPPVPTL